MPMKRRGGGIPLLYVREKWRGHGERGAALILERNRERQRMLRIARAIPPHLRLPLPPGTARATGPFRRGARSLEAARVLNLIKLT